MRKSTKPFSSARVRLALLALPAAFASVALSSCNKHVFEVVPRDCTVEQDKEEPIAVDTPADILIVVDNSGSMCEEQQNLVDNFFDPDCPIQDLDNIEPRFRNPTKDIIQTELGNCGFVQLLAAYDNNWRLGVITTDVGQCDNRFGLAEEGYTCDGEQIDWGRRPQRGCLQPDDAGNKVLKRGDANVGESFKQILTNIQTFGSAFERGLDAMQVFLSPNASRAPGCDGDLDSFLRDDAKLVVIFLTDEDDCSHADGEFGLPDENAGESCDAATDLTHTTFQTGDCYTKRDELAPTTRYSSFLKNYKGDENLVSVAVIAGALKNEDGAVTPGGCLTSPQGTPVGGCFESGGNSNTTTPLWADVNVDNNEQGAICAPDHPRDQQCCQADSGGRYFQFAREVGNFLNDSICFESFRQTMLDIASFIAASDFVTLQERPKRSSAIIVEITRAGDDEPTSILRIPDGEDPTGKDGWQYDGDRTVTFYGDAKPRSGDTIHVAALANRDEATAGCVGTEGSEDADPDAGSN